MNKLVLLPSLGLGIVFILIYISLHRKNGRAIDLKNIVSLVLGASGIVCGVLLAAASASKDAEKMMDDLSIYIFIAGIFVIYASLQSVRRELQMAERGAISERSAVVILILTASILASLSTLEAGRLNDSYLSRHPLEGDTASYTLMNVRAGEDALTHGRWEAIHRQLRENGRNPLRIVPVQALNPAWLLSMNGHLVTGVFGLACFLSMLGIVARQRTGSLLFACSAMLFPLTAKGFFNPTRGFAANYPDYVAGLFFASGFLALMWSKEGRSIGGLVAFGIFAALTALSRWTASGYIFFTCAPVLAFYLGLRFREEWLARSHPWRCLGTRLLAVSLPLLLLSGYFLIKFSGENIAFYKVMAYGLFAPWEASNSEIMRMCSEYMGTPTLVALGAAFLFFVAIGARSLMNLREVVVALWGASSFYLLYVHVLRLAGDPSTPFHWPSLLCASLLMPVTIFPQRINLVAMAIGICLLAAAAHRLPTNIRMQKAFTRHVSKADAEEKRFIREASELLAEAGKSRGNTVPVTFDTYFFEYGRTLYIEAAMLGGKTVWMNDFSKHDVNWAHRFPNMSGDQIVEHLMPNLKTRLELIYVMDDPNASKAKPLFMKDLGDMNVISPAVVQAMDRALKADASTWAFIRRIESPWGAVLIYRNQLLLAPKL